VGLQSLTGLLWKNYEVRLTGSYNMRVINIDSIQRNWKWLCQDDTYSDSDSVCHTSVSKIQMNLPKYV